MPFTKGHTGFRTNASYKNQSLKMKGHLVSDKVIETTGENNWAWKGGVTSINKTIRASFEYKLWREAVFQRDNYTCQNPSCGARSSKGNPVTLNADHIKSFADYPELRFAIDNGRTLCLPCHKDTDTYLSNYYKGRTISVSRKK